MDMMISGFVRGADGVRPIEILIFAPEQVPGAVAYQCLVRAPAVLQKDARIHGIDADQARQLAVSFMKEMLGNSVIEDSSGNAIDW